MRLYWFHVYVGMCWHLCQRPPVPSSHGCINNCQIPLFSAFILISKLSPSFIFRTMAAVRKIIISKSKQEGSTDEALEVVGLLCRRRAVTTDGGQVAVQSTH